MTTLDALQRQFMACLHDDDAPLPGVWDAKRTAGMAVYRGAFRARLIDVMAETYPRTARLVGDDAFRQAATHHLVLHPPAGWSIDQAGQGFAQSCADLFARDPDVAEMAWLEWAMHCAYTAADAQPLSRSQFADMTCDFGPDAWASLRLHLMPGTAIRPVTYDVGALWASLDDDGTASDAKPLVSPAHVLVWRDAMVPRFILLNRDEGEATAALLGGETFGRICAQLAQRTDPQKAAMRAGALLSTLIDCGMVYALGE